MKKLKIKNYRKGKKGFTEKTIEGVLLVSVESFVDRKGIHPIDVKTHVPDMRKSQVVAWSEIEPFEFMDIMSTADAIAYRGAMKEYIPHSIDTAVWVDKNYDLHLTER